MTKRHCLLLALSVCVLVAAAGFAGQIAAQPGGPCSFDQMHERFQETGMPKARSVNWDAAPIAARIAESARGRVTLLVNSPWSESLQGAIYRQKPYADIDTLFERVSTGNIPKDLDAPDRIAAYFDDTQMIVIHEDWQTDPRVVNFTNPINGAFFDMLFARYQMIRPQFMQIATAPYPEQGGRILILKRIRKAPKMPTTGASPFAGLK